MREQAKDQLIDVDTHNDGGYEEEDVEEVVSQRSRPRPLPGWIVIGIIVILVLILLFTVFGVGTLMQHPPLQNSLNTAQHVALLLRTSLA